jgi:hypothetical protein
MRLLLSIVLAVALFAPALAPPVALARQSAASTMIPDLAKLRAMTERFAPTRMDVDVSHLSPGDRQALAKLIEASRVLNHIFLQQMWSGNLALYQKLQQDTTPLGRARLDYFWLNKSPWSEVDEHAAFLPGVPAKKLPGANFYPEDMTRQEFESWAATLSPKDKEQAIGFFTVIRRDAARKLRIVPYNAEYQADLERAAVLLRQAAALTENASLRMFLVARADAFASNDYFASDMAWMDLDAPVDVTIGPYETYNDEIFGYKAAFESYINVRDEEASARLAFLGSHLQDIENNLPEDPQYRNAKLGALAPIRVVDQVFTAGDGAHGVQTAAYNLPNDDNVVQQKGAKRVMLKNVQDAKFRATLVPISQVVLPPDARNDLSFDLFFTHIVAHELSHGLGPHQIKVNGRDTNPRFELKDQYGPIEEAKADVTGLFALQFLMTQADAGRISMPLPHGPGAERQLYTTYLASAFRTLRFGLQDAHARGQAMQFNYLLDRGGFVANADGTFHVNMAKIKDALRALDHDLLTVEATGDYAGAQKLLALGALRPEVKKALERLQSIPTDIVPDFTTAHSLVPFTDPGSITAR